MELIEWPLHEKAPALSAEYHAQRARDLWGLWNKGFAVAKLLAHFPHPEGKRKTYITIYDASNQSEIQHIEEVKTCLCRFLFEFERLRGHHLLDGWFRPILVNPGKTHSHYGAINRLVLVPAKTQEDGFSIHDEQAIFTAAWKVLQSEFEVQQLPVFTPHSHWKSDMFRWLTEQYGPVLFPYPKKKFKNMGSNPFLHLGRTKIGTQFSLLTTQSTSAGKDEVVERISLRGTDDTNFSVYFPRHRREEVDKCRDIPLIPTNIVTNLKTDDQQTTAMLQTSISDTWYSFISCLRENSTTRVHANMVFSLAAELIEGYSNVLPVLRKEYTTFTATYEIQLDVDHPNWGKLQHPNALEFADMAYEENFGQVAINNVFDPLTWAKRNIFQISKQQDADPHTLLLRRTEENGEADWPEQGFLKISNQGNRSIANRKHLLAKKASSLQVIDERLEPYDPDAFEWLEQHNQLTRNLELGPEWRLDSKGPMQLIQGPPGTGKTWTSTRLIEDILHRNPSARILICSKEHLALDHLVETVRKSINEEEIRIARIQSSTTSSSDSAGVCWENTSEHYWKGLIAEAPSSVDSLAFNDGENGLKFWTYGAFLEECQIISTTTTDVFLLDNIRRSQPLVFDYCIVEEAGKSYISELIGAFAFSRHWILVGDQMQLPPYQIQQARKHYSVILSMMKKHNDKSTSSRSNERGKNSPDYVERMLDELKQILLWGITGNYEDYEYMEKHMDASFEPFKTHFGHLKNRSATHFLPEQRRMFQLLSELISTIFYDIPFLWKKDNQLDDSSLPNLFQKHGRLIFLDTPHSSREKKWKETLNQRHSRQNMEEAKTVIRTLKSFDPACNIVILTPYNGQVDLIRGLLPSKYEHIEVFTTDGFQGKEADFILLSLVRNNILSGRRRWGFVTDPHRLNVALSRAREGLVLISSQQQIEESEMENGSDHLLQALEFFKKHGAILPIKEIRRGS